MYNYPAHTFLSFTVNHSVIELFISLPKGNFHVINETFLSYLIFETRACELFIQKPYHRSTFSNITKDNNHLFLFQINKTQYINVFSFYQVNRNHNRNEIPYKFRYLGLWNIWRFRELSNLFNLVHKQPQQS